MSCWVPLSPTTPNSQLPLLEGSSQPPPHAPSRSFFSAASLICRSRRRPGAGGERARQRKCLHRRRRHGCRYPWDFARRPAFRCHRALRRQGPLAVWENKKGGSPALWTVADGVATVKAALAASARARLSPPQLHPEWATPSASDGQGSGNSGASCRARYGVQVLHSYQNETYWHGSVYLSTRVPPVKRVTKAGRVADLRRRLPCTGIRHRWQGQPPVTLATTSTACGHLAQAHPVKPTSGGCEECLRIGSTWVHLRICMICGHVGCCDSSPHRHATAHYHASGHPIMRSGEPEETWGWCYVDQVEL